LTRPNGSHSLKASVRQFRSSEPAQRADHLREESTNMKKVTLSPQTLI